VLEISPTSLITNHFFNMGTIAVFILVAVVAFAGFIAAKMYRIAKEGGTVTTGYVVSSAIGAIGIASIAVWLA
jgi:hypothetical protein